MAFGLSVIRSGRSIRRRALTRGLLGPSAAWRTVGLVIHGAALLRRAIARRPEVLDVARLRPGEGLVVSTAARRRRTSLGRGRS